MLRGCVYLQVCVSKRFKIPKFCRVAANTPENRWEADGFYRAL